MIKNQVEFLCENLNQEDKERFIRMCWEDRTPFEMISKQFDLSVNDIVKLMRKLLPANRFKSWRERVFKQGRLKNLAKRSNEVSRFKCSRQRLDGSTKGYK